MGVFRGAPPRYRARNFCSVNSEYILCRQQWRATAVEQRPDTAATAALSSCNSVKFSNVYRILTIPGTLPVTTCKSERVLHAAAANADVGPFYRDGDSTRDASVAAMPPRALSYSSDVLS